MAVSVFYIPAQFFLLPLLAIFIPLLHINIIIALFDSKFFLIKFAPNIRGFTLF